MRRITKTGSINNSEILDITLGPYKFQRVIISFDKLSASNGTIKLTNAPPELTEQREVTGSLVNLAAAGTPESVCIKDQDFGDVKLEASGIVSGPVNYALTFLES